jgi:hypothetical protein
MLGRADDRAEVPAAGGAAQVAEPDQPFDDDIPF